MRVLLLGGSGYIGSYLEQMAAPRGVSVFAPPRQRLDLLNHRSVSLFFKEELPFDVVIHLSTINKYRCSSQEIARCNVTMTKNLLSNLSYVTNLVFASTIDVYGSSPTLPLNENSTLNPESWYAESKVQCEQLIADSIAPEASRHVVLRLPGMYGNLRVGGAVVDQMARRILGQSSNFELRDSKVLRDWVYARDFWKLLWSITDQPTYNRSRYNLATGVSWPIEMWYREISACLKRLSGDIPVKTAPATKDAYDLTFDTTALREDFGDFCFTPRIRTFLDYSS